MTQTFVKFEEYVAPMKAVAELTLANYEKVVGLNAEMYSKYSAMMLENMREAMTVTDMDAAKAYAEKANGKAKEMMDTVIADSKVYADLSKEYTTEVQKMVTDEVEKVTKKAA